MSPRVQNPWVGFDKAQLGALPTTEQRAIVEGEERERAEAAMAAKSEWEKMVAGAEARISTLKRELIPLLGFGVAEVMLMQVLNGTLEVKDAKQAAEVAKIALELARTEQGESRENLGVALTADERAKREARIAAMAAEVAAKNAADPGRGWVPPDETGVGDSSGEGPSLPGGVLGIVRGSEVVTPDTGPSTKESA